MMIREAQVEDLPKLEPCAREFYTASHFLKNFDPERFVDMWTALLDSGAGAILLLTDEDTGEIHGTLGGVVYPEPYSGTLVATEFFWFVKEARRGEGLRLLRAFEAWARDKGCAQIRMAHLVDVMPAKLEKVYRRFGYTPAEVLYVKELQP
jgi:GNAT superfamily N-acetyltransferase